MGDTSLPAADADERFGIWWVAGSDREAVPGTLVRRTDGRQTLKLSGHLLEPNERGTFLILGTFGIGNIVSLCGCHLLQCDFIGAAPRQDLYVAESVWGVELSSDADWKFIGATFALPGLTRWAAWQQFATKLEKQDEDAGKLSVSVAQMDTSLWSRNGIDVALYSAISTNEQKEDRIERMRLVWAHG